MQKIISLVSLLSLVVLTTTPSFARAPLTHEDVSTIIEQIEQGNGEQIRDQLSFEEETFLRELVATGEIKKYQSLPDEPEEEIQTAAGCRCTGPLLQGCGFGVPATCAVLRGCRVVCDNNSSGGSGSETDKTSL